VENWTANLATWYRFTKGLTQNLNLRKHLKLDYNIKSLNPIQKNYNFHAWFLLYWTIFNLLHAQGFKGY